MDTLVRSDGMPMKRGKICGAVCPLSEVNETRGNVTGETEFCRVPLILRRNLLKGRLCCYGIIQFRS